MCDQFFENGPFQKGSNLRKIPNNRLFYATMWHCQLINFTVAGKILCSVSEMPDIKDKGKDFEKKIASNTGVLEATRFGNKRGGLQSRPL